MKKPYLVIVVVTAYTHTYSHVSLHIHFKGTHLFGEPYEHSELCL